MGAARSSTASLRLAGSLSAPLATITLRPRARATMPSLRYTGKAAPPRPVRSRLLDAVDQQPGAAPVGQPAVPGQVGAQVFRDPGDQRQQAGQPGRILAA